MVYIVGYICLQLSRISCLFLLMIYLLMIIVYSFLSFSLVRGFRNYVGIETCKVPDHSGLTTDRDRKSVV